MPIDFQVPDNMLYGSPQSMLDGDLNYVSYKPVSGETFTSGKSFKININSDNEWLVPQKSYLKFNLKLTGGATTAGNCITTLGAASVLQRVTTSVSGRNIEDTPDYPTYVSSLYKRATTTQQNALKELELYGNQTLLTVSANAYSNGYTVCHAIRNALFECDQNIPVAFLAGGINVEIELSDYRKLLANTAGGSTDFSVSSVELICGMLKPSDSYIKQFQASLSAGRQATIPMTIIRAFKTQPSTSSSEQALQLQCGFHRSLRSVLAVRKLSSNINSTSADEFNVDTLAGLKEYYFQIGSQRWPRNCTIKTQNDVSVSAPCAEHYMQMLTSLDNTFPHLNAVAHSGTNTGQAIYYNFASNRSFGQGVPIEDGTLTINLSHNSSPSATDMTVFLAIDAVLKIDVSDVSFTTQDIFA